MINRLPSDEGSSPGSVEPTLPSVRHASDEQIRKREKLLQLVNKAEPTAEKIEKLGKEIVESARRVRDTASPLKTLVSEVPASEFPEDMLDTLIGSLSSWQAGADKVSGMEISVNSFSALSLNTLSTESTVFSAVELIAFPSSASRKAVENASAQLQLTISQSSRLESVRSEMHRLGLDLRHENFETPLRLVTQSCEALNQPLGEDSAAVTVLIPLREGIVAVVSELLKRRPIQEPVSKRNKILSLGRQCGRPDLDEGHFERLARDAEALNGDLSEGKQAKLSRACVKELTNRGLLFLSALLTSIDENRLRRFPPN